MATRKKPGETLNIEDVFPQQPATQLRTVTVPEPAPEPVEYDDVTALNNVLSEIGADEEGGGFVVVEREFKTESGKWDKEYLDRFVASEFNLDMLKSRYGAGKYKINVYHGGGLGLATRKVINIAKDPNAVPPVTATVAPAPATDLTPILQTMQQGFEKMIGIMVQSQQKPQSREEMLREMMLMKEMFTPATPAAPPQQGLLEALKLGMEMANNGAGGDSNNAWVGKMIDQFGPLLAPAVAATLTPAAPAVLQVNPTSRLPSPRPDAAVVQTQPIEEENPVNIIVVQYLNMLKQAADKKADVGEYADSILASIPASSVTDIENLLRPADWREQVKKHTQAVEQYPEWFGALRDTLLMYIDEDKASALASTHLTTEEPSGSVLDHADDNTGKLATNEGDPSVVA